MGVAEIVPQIPVPKASYAAGRPLGLPVNVTVSASHRSNTRSAKVATIVALSHAAAHKKPAGGSGIDGGAS